MSWGYLVEVLVGEVIPLRDRWSELVDALREYVANDTDGGHLGDFVIVAASATIEDVGDNRTRYCVVSPGAQPSHSTVGLLHYALDNYEADFDDD
jgi:hypothetical protein